MMWFLIAALILAGFLFFVSRKPDTFSLQRSTSIAAPAADVFSWINAPKRFNQWNPWALSDPTSNITYSGPDDGPGAAYAWVGKKNGEGSMTLLTQQAHREVNFALEFVKPFKASNKAVFTLADNAGHTTVTWAMSGQNSFFNKLFQTFVSMDKMVGKDFEKGLSNLKGLVENKKLT
jgi:hypothetical protein